MIKIQKSSFTNKYNIFFTVLGTQMSYYTLQQVKLLFDIKQKFDEHINFKKYVNNKSRKLLVIGGHGVSWDLLASPRQQDLLSNFGHTHRRNWSHLGYRTDLKL